MMWTFDRVVNLTEERLNTIISVLEEFKDNYDPVAIYERLIEHGYVNEPSIEDGKTREEVYRKKWGSYVGTINAYGIAIIEDKSVRFTDITKAYMNKEISFRQFVEYQMLKWQLPNGGLTSKKQNEYLEENILLKPFILVLQVLLALREKSIFEAWVDAYDINNHLLKAQNNEESTVESIKDSIIQDRRAGNDRTVSDFKLDVIFNTFCSTGLIEKTEAPTFVPVRSVYTLNESKVMYIKDVVSKYKKPRFIDETDIQNKDKWLDYYGSYERETVHIKGENVILYGTPGTGKSYEINRRYPNNQIRVTFHPEYTYHDFVGSYKPVPVYKETSSTLKERDNSLFDKGEPLIDYRFSPGPFTIALARALSKPKELHTLIIEEINRANAPSVFGDLFQLLDRDENGNSIYPVANPEIAAYLRKESSIVENLKDKGVDIENTDEIIIPNNLNIVATMNSADQGVFVMDSAFKRRWNFEYLPIDLENAEHKDELVPYNGQFVRWKDFVEAINKCLSEHEINEDKHIGPYFMKKGEPSNQDLVASKLLIYLWDDVVRHKRNKLFKGVKTFSELVKKYKAGLDIFNVEFKYVDVAGEVFVENEDEEHE